MRDNDRRRRLPFGTRRVTASSVTGGGVVWYCTASNAAIRDRSRSDRKEKVQAQDNNARRARATLMII